MVDHSEVPALLPLNGVCFETDTTTKRKALRQMEYIALGLLGTMPREEINITFVDIALNTTSPSYAQWTCLMFALLQVRRH